MPKDLPCSKIIQHKILILLKTKLPFLDQKQTTMPRLQYITFTIDVIIEFISQYFCTSNKMIKSLFLQISKILVALQPPDLIIYATQHLALDFTLRCNAQCKF